MGASFITVGSHIEFQDSGLILPSGALGLSDVPVFFASILALVYILTDL